MSNAPFFTHLSQAWYAEANLKHLEFVDEIMLGDDGIEGEFAIRWYELGGQIVPRLEVFSDSWELLAHSNKLIDLIYQIQFSRPRVEATPFVVAQVLRDSGWEDRTPTENPYEKPDEDDGLSALDHAYAIERMLSPHIHENDAAGSKEVMSEIAALIAKLEGSR